VATAVEASPQVPETKICPLCNGEISIRDVRSRNTHLLLVNREQVIVHATCPGEAA